MASVFNREKFEIGKEKEDRGKVRGTGRRQLMTEMTADRERTGRGSGGRGLEAGQTVSDSEDVREISLQLTDKRKNTVETHIFCFFLQKLLQMFLYCEVR